MVKFSQISILGIAAIVGMVAGCDDFLGANTRWFDKDNIRLWSQLRFGEPTEYYVIELGNGHHPLAQQSPDVKLEFPNGHVYELSSLSAEVVESQGTHVSELMGGEAEGWEEGIRLIGMPGYTFWIKDNQVMAIQIHTKGLEGAWRPAIGSVKSGRMYHLPLDEEAARRVFGKPDRVRDFYMN